MSLCLIWQPSISKWIISFLFVGMDCHMDRGFLLSYFYSVLPYLYCPCHVPAMWNSCFSFLFSFSYYKLYLLLSDTRFQFLQKRHCLEKRSGIYSLPGTGSIQMVLAPTGLLAQDTGKLQVQINPSLLRVETCLLESRRLWFSMSEKHLKETRLIGLCTNTVLLMSIDLQRRRAA